MTSTAPTTSAAAAAAAETELNLARLKGLSSEEAAHRLQEDGFNELQHQKPRSIFAIAFGVLKEPMFILLIICVVLCFILKDFEEGGILSSFVIFIIGITIFQERKTERALDALKDLSAPRALLIRDGKQITVPGREVVRGDTILLKEGDRVAADTIVTWALSLSADESLLTGECVPVRKCAIDGGADAAETAVLSKPGGDDTSSCFSGSVIVSGRGVGVVKATGTNTNLGKIGKSLAELKEERTPLEKETNRLVLVMAIFGVAAAIGVFLIFGLARKKWLDGALVAISLAMGLLPEEFPVILTVFLSLGAWRISKSQVLTRRNSAIETLGACTVLCTDKTGTLTVNQMMVQSLWDMHTDHTFHFRDPSDTEERVDDECHEIVEFAVLASQRDPFDPMETALKRLIENKSVDADHSHISWKMLREYPLSKEMLAVTRVYHAADSEDKYLVAVKGAPEAVGDLCHLDAVAFARVRSVVNDFAALGLRVLGVARAVHPRVDVDHLPGIQHDYEFAFVGLVGFVDPIRSSVPESVKIAHRAGMKVVMITGDYPGTAKAIAQKIGLPADKIITGPELDVMPDAELALAIKDTCVFARIVPEQKLKIVQAFKALGHIVAMTGDGVNDAPALKAAHIGVAMGKRGTDVAREASHLVLLDDDFSSIVRAVKLGRRIFDNLQKAMCYVISIHVPLAGLVLFPTLFGWTVVLRPVHIVFLEMVIDPACSVVLEAESEEPDIMERSPRNVKKSMISWGAAGMAALQGSIILAVCLVLYHFATHPEFGAATIEQATALTFGTLIIANLCLIIEDRSWTAWIGAVLRRPNKPMWVVIGIVIPALFLVLFVPGVNTLFKFKDVRPIDIPIFIGAGIITTIWFEIFKLCNRCYIKYQYYKRVALERNDIEMGRVDTGNSSVPQHRHRPNVDREAPAEQSQSLLHDPAKKDKPTDVVEVVEVALK